MMATPAELTAGIPNATYHAMEGISSTQHKASLECPALYKAGADGLLPFKQTPAMALGTAVHALVLEPDQVDSQLIVMPEFGRSKVAMADKELFHVEHKDKLILTQEDMDKAKAMAASLLVVPDAQAILKDSDNELSGWVTDPETGLLIKYRPDARTSWCIADVKTCVDASPKGFSRSIDKFCYALSAAHYLHIDAILSGSNHQQFVFLCVESKPPYLTAVYVLREASLEYGEWQRRKALGIIKHCTDTGVWPSYNGGVATNIDVPQWALNKMEYGE